jgi:hypothetical protein
VFPSGSLAAMQATSSSCTARCGRWTGCRRGQAARARRLLAPCRAGSSRRSRLLVGHPCSSIVAAAPGDTRRDACPTCWHEHV